MAESDELRRLHNGTGWYGRRICEGHIFPDMSHRFLGHQRMLTLYISQIYACYQWQLYVWQEQEFAYSVGPGLEASIRGIRSWAKSDLRRFDAQYNVAYTCNLNIILFNRYLFSKHTDARTYTLGTYIRTYIQEWHKIWRYAKILYDTQVISCKPAKMRYEPGHIISYIIACTPSEDSDQPVHPRSLISLRMALCG